MAWMEVNCAHCHNPAGPARTSGLDLQRAWDEALMDFAVYPAIIRIGLIRPQVIDHGLASLGIEVKPSDSRSKKYIQQFGTTCWEADVLPAAVLRNAINHEIASRLDMAAWRQRAEEIERARQLL